MIGDEDLLIADLADRISELEGALRTALSMAVGSGLYSPDVTQPIVDILDGRHLT